MPKRSKRTRLFRTLAIILLLLIVTLYIGLPLVMALAAVTPDRSAAGEPPAGFRTVTLLADDGVTLAGWYAEPQNGVVIILVHGAGSGRASVRSHATMLHAHGFGVLAPNMRGYGDSGGNINRLGWAGTRDIGAAVAFLAGRTDVERIGALGLSMGGEIVLGAASGYPALQAVAAEGATSRAVNEYRALPANRSLWRSFTQSVFTLFVRLFSRRPPPEPPLLESIRQAPGTAFLFIAAGNEEDEIAYNTLFAQAAGARGSLWVIPGVGHTAGYAAVPAEYEARVVDFFTGSLVGE